MQKLCLEGRPFSHYNCDKKVVFLYALFSFYFCFSENRFCLFSQEGKRKRRVHPRIVKAEVVLPKSGKQFLIIHG